MTAENTHRARFCLQELSSAFSAQLINAKESKWAPRSMHATAALWRTILLWIVALVVVGSALAQPVAAAGGIVTLAGTGSPGFSGDNAAATAAQLSYPIGVAVNGAGDLYVADIANHRIRKVDAVTGFISTVAGTGSPGFSGDNALATAAQLSGPAGVAVDGADNLYIADQSNHRIRKVDAVTGFISTVAGNGSPGFSGDNALATAAPLSGPAGVAVDGAGNLYIADQSNHRIRKVDAVTGFISTVAGTGSPGFSGDNALATAAQLSGPAGVAVDGAGNLYIADQSNHRIRKVDAVTSFVSTVAGNGSQGFSGDNAAATAARLSYPIGVAVNGAGDLYIADMPNHRVRKLDAVTGYISTVAGNGSLGFSGDGALATAAQLSNPGGVAIDSAGNLYIADQGNHRIRKVEVVLPPDAPTNVTATAGNGSATVSWTAPSSDGGSAIQSYTVNATPGGPQACAASPCTINGLTNGTAYTFTVIATNGVGPSPASAASNPAVVPRGVQTISFGALAAQNLGVTPPALSATATSGLAVAFASTTPTVCTVSSTTVTLLAGGTCTVEATQPGNAAWLAATPVQQSFAVNPVVPGVPTGVQATAGNAQATVSWTAPSFVGSSALIGYRAEVVGDPTKFCSPAAPATGTSCSINGLANGTSYTFQVFATNGAGNSAASAASTSVTPQAPASGGGGGGGSTPPTGGAITVPTNGSATLGGAGSATLGMGATLTVQPQAAGSPISPPAGTANVVLGAAGGSVTLGQPVGTTNGQAVVLSPAPGQSAPVLGLQGGSVVVGSSTPGQVLLDIGPTGTGGVASGQQVVAGPNGARIEARRDANGSTTVQVHEGSAVVPCGAPCPQATNGAPAPTITLLQGEVATIDAQGKVRQVNVSTPALQPQPAPTGIVLPAALPSLTGTPPARTPGQTLLEQARVGLQALLGQPLASQGQQALGNAIWALEGGLSLGLMPLGPPQVDLTLPNGASLTPDGTLRIVYQGVVQRFGPAPVDLQATGEALRAVLPQAQLRIADTGSWWVEIAGGTGAGAPLVLRPGWLAQQGAPLQPPVPRFETDAAGQLWLAQANGLRTPLYPALAEPAGLQALLSAADAQASLQVDGTAVARLAGQSYWLQPLPALQPIPAQRAGQALWLEVSQGQLLLWVRVGDGRWAQAMVVSLMP